MQGDSERHKLFNRRTAMLGVGKLALCGILGGRMYYLQVVEAERYSMLADENRINLRLLPPPRGRIVDRFGVPLADNKQNYRVMLVSENTRDRDVSGTLDMLGQIVPLTDGERRRILREVQRRRSFVPVTLRENLDWEEVAQIEVNAPDLPGIQIDEGQSRFYPYGTHLAHVLGYVSAVTEKEKTGDRLLELPGFRTGKSGVEKVHDLSLRGVGGASQVEVNAYGRMIRELNRREGLPGKEIRLTIDMGLQLFSDERLAREGSGSAVVMDAHTGDVLAMSSVPAFDPNAFNRGLTSGEWQQLANNERAPLINKAISGRYAPGSTFKMIVALTALERGVINANTRFNCSGKLEFGDSVFHCWKRGGHGSMNLEESLRESCDVYYYEIARRVGIDRIAEMANRFGLGLRTGLDLPGENAGLMPTKAWKRKVKDQPWHQGETLIAGIGQGYVLTTPLQLAVMTARMVNGGRKVAPRIAMAPDDQAVQDLRLSETERAAGLSAAGQGVSAKDGKEPPAAGAPSEPETVGVSTQYLNLMKAAMEAVNNHPKGTAYKARIEDPEYAFAGKTGTAQVRRITKAEREAGVRKNQDLPWRFRDHALYVGYAPQHDPRYVVAVVVEHGGGGSTVAAPIARDILMEAQRRGSARPVPSGPSVQNVDWLAPGEPEKPDLGET